MPSQQRHFLADLEAAAEHPGKRLRARGRLHTYLQRDLRLRGNFWRTGWLRIEHGQVFGMVDERLRKMRTGSQDLECAADLLRLLPRQTEQFGRAEQGRDKPHHTLPGSIRDRDLAHQIAQLRSLGVEVTECRGKGVRSAVRGQSGQGLEAEGYP